MATDRNKRLYSARNDQGLTFVELGKRFRISGTRARQLFKKEEERQRNPVNRIDRLALLTIAEQCGVRTPTLIDLQKMLQGLENGNGKGWERELLAMKYIGRRSLRVIKEVAAENGILPKEKIREKMPGSESVDESTFRIRGQVSFKTLFAVQRHTGKDEPTIGDVVEMIARLEKEHGSWETGFRKTSFTTAKEVREVRIVYSGYKAWKDRIPNPEQA